MRTSGNRRIGINPDSLAPKLLKEAVMNQRVQEEITPASGAVSNVTTSTIINNNRSEYKPYIE